MLSAAPLVAFVATTDLERSHEFYGGVLGLERVEAGLFANTYDAAGTSLRAIRVEAVAPAPYTVLGWSVPDVAAKITELRAQGVAFKRYDGFEQDDAGVWTAPSGARIAWFDDPDGNTLSVTQSP